MIYPEHYDRGWHITGSTGMLGAAAACARLLHLDADRTAMALGIAASQPVGVREQFGSMTKPFHPGGAARAGLTAALMAKHGFTASPRAIEAPRGIAQTYSTKCAWNEITDQLGERFEIAFNTYKPFACGIVIHPSIDGCVQLRNAHGLRADRSRASTCASIRSCSSSPASGRRAAASKASSACSTRAPPASCSGVPASANSPTRRSRVPTSSALRDRVQAHVDDRIDEASADVTVTMNDGRKHHVFVEHAIGSLERPMSDDDLAAKFHDLVDPELGEARGEGAFHARHAHRLGAGPSRTRPPSPAPKPSAMQSYWMQMTRRHGARAPRRPIPGPPARSSSWSACARRRSTVASSCSRTARSASQAPGKRSAAKAPAKS
jgi:2-methylcitrate dehydratase PrpD